MPIIPREDLFVRRKCEVSAKKAEECTQLHNDDLSIVGNTQIKINSDEDIEAMRVVGKLARECLDEGAKVCGVGVTTDEIDRIVHEGKNRIGIADLVFTFSTFSCY